MTTFYPKTTEPATELVNSIITFLREGHPQLHDPAPPAWADGDPCPAGHFSIPEGTYLYSGYAPEEAQTPYIAVGVHDACLRHVPDDDRVWDVPVKILYVENQDTWDPDDTPEVLRQLQNDLFANAAIETPTYTEYPATERLTRSDIHVFYIYDVRVGPVTEEIGQMHPGHALTAWIRCSGITPG